ncbi:MAG: hypothetical protein GKR90_20735 [Pseudomonadales bacterium]|nr:hypothetical protein [Pseudomonadales bacterium]
MRRGDTDPDKVYFRSDSRLFRMNEQWFFSSREGDQGPYSTEIEAQGELTRHVAASQELSPLRDSSNAPVINLEVVIDRRSEQVHAPRTDSTQNLSLSDIKNSSLQAYRERARFRAR